MKARKEVAGQARRIGKSDRLDGLEGQAYRMAAMAVETGTMDKKEHWTGKSRTNMRNRQALSLGTDKQER